MGKKLTTSEFIERANSIHHEKYDYSKSNYVNCMTNIVIICPTHGEFLQCPNNHINMSNGCPRCGIDKKPQCKPKCTEKFITDAKNIHGNKYDYSESNYTDVKTKIVIICPIHGKFMQIAGRHLSGCGCYECGRETTINSRKINPLEFVQKLKQIHNDEYDYSKVNYDGCYKNITIICKKHGEFNQKAYVHLQDHGCPKCNNGVTSKIENEFLDYIKITDRNKRVKCFLVDGIDYTTNTIYEFLGDYWHGNPKIYNFNDVNRSNKETFGKLYEETFERFDKIKLLGYNVKYIWENDWKEFKNKNSNNLKLLSV